jgi:hypothetical protein
MIRLDFDERDLRSLRVFCNVAEAGGLAAAERVLLMSKASISRHVREVEERLGVRLCERGPAGFRLTPEGEWRSSWLPPPCVRWSASAPRSMPCMACCPGHWRWGWWSMP